MRKLLIASVLIASGGAVTAATSGWLGNYTTQEPQLISGSKSDNYLTIYKMSGGGIRATFEVASAGCIGEVDFRAPSLPTSDQMVLSTTGYSGEICIMRMRRSGDTIIASEQGCEGFRGMQCTFSGAYRKNQ